MVRMKRSGLVREARQLDAGLARKQRRLSDDKRRLMLALSSTNPVLRMGVAAALGFIVGRSTSHTGVLYHANRIRRYGAVAGGVIHWLTAGA